VVENAREQLRHNDTRHDSTLGAGMQGRDVVLKFSFVGKIGEGRF
jgi:hypothetical protein